MSLLSVVQGIVGSRATPHFEILALRDQLQVLQRPQPRPVRLTNADR
jgi:hypothetical protein